MFGSMFIGLSGMGAYSNGLRQVSNNITNLNSQGYRASEVGFSDLFRGGVNGISYSGSQAGHGDGVEISDLRLDFTQGELRQTGRGLDLAVDGNGFLVLENNGEYIYARTGNFEIDNDGFIVMSGTNYKLTILDETGTAVPVSIDDHRTSRPEATTSVTFSGNLSSTATDDFNLQNITVYSDVGEADTWNVNYARAASAVDGEWDVTVTNSAGDVIGTETLRFIGGIVDPATDTLNFTDAAGRSIDLDFSGNVTSFSSGDVSSLTFSDVDGYALGEIINVSVNGDGRLEIGYSNNETLELGSISLANFRDLQALEQRSGGLFAFDGSGGRELYSSESRQVGNVLSGRVEASNVDLSQQFGDMILVQRGYQASSQIVSVSNEMIQQLFGIRGR